MITPEIILFIKQQQATGVLPHNIKISLQSNGWQEADILEAFKQAGIQYSTNSVVPRPPAYNSPLNSTFQNQTVLNRPPHVTFLASLIIIEAVIILIIEIFLGIVIFPGLLWFIYASEMIALSVSFSLLLLSVCELICCLHIIKSSIELLRGKSSGLTRLFAFLPPLIVTHGFLVFYASNALEGFLSLFTLAMIVGSVILLYLTAISLRASIANNSFLSTSANNPDRLKILRFRNYVIALMIVGILFFLPLFLIV